MSNDNENPLTFSPLEESPFEFVPLVVLPDCSARTLGVIAGEMADVRDGFASYGIPFSLELRERALLVGLIEDTRITARKLASVVKTPPRDDGQFVNGWFAVNGWIVVPCLN